MAVATTFCQFFGCPSSGGGSGGGHDPDDTIDYSFHLQLDQAGKSFVYINDDTSISTFMAIIHKERKTKIETEHGFEEMTLREVKFPANNTTGRETVLMHAECRVNAVRYQIRSYERKADFWVCELKRVNMGEVSRSNRRGKV